MGDRDEKLARLLETIGHGADPDFAKEVLLANEWDLEASARVILGEGARVAPAAAPALDRGASEVRAPMRTGFYETLLADPAEQARQERAEGGGAAERGGRGDRSRVGRVYGDSDIYIYVYIFL